MDAQTNFTFLVSDIALFNAKALLVPKDAGLSRLVRRCSVEEKNFCSGYGLANVPLGMIGDMD